MNSSAPRKRRRMQCALVALGSFSACAMAAAPANIDVGFVQDGRTTYCQGIQEDAGPLVFETLETSSAGHCPIDVQIWAEATSVAPLSPLAVKWAASVHRGALTSNLFPGAVDQTSHKPLDVIASLLRACKVGTNCGESVIEPAVFTDDPSTDTGSFDGSGTKTLKSYQFRFPKAGDDYVLVAKVVLPGDPKLNVSAQEFVAFQRISVGTNVTTKTPATGTGGTVHPGDANEVVSDSDAGVLTRSAKTTAAPETRSTDAASTSSPVSGESTSSTSTKSSQSSDLKTISIVGVAGIALVVVVVGYALMGVHEKRKLEAFARRQTRTFSAVMPDLDSDPEPMAPMRRLPSQASSIQSGASRATTTRISQQSHPMRPSRVSRHSRTSRPSRVNGPKISGADVVGTPSSSRAGMYTNLHDTGRATAGSRHTMSPRQSQRQSQSQYGWTRWSAAPPPHEVLRPSQKHQMPGRPSSRPSSHHSYGQASAVYRASKLSHSSSASSPVIVRVTRVLSTSSTKSEDYSSEGSVFSVSGGTTRGAAPSYENAAIMESAEMMAAANRRSSVALLDSRDSDLSSLGDLHDNDHSGDLIPWTVPRTSSIAEDNVQRLSSRVLTESASSFSKSGFDMSQMSREGSAFYARDMSEYGASFGDRDSESEWMDYQL